VPAPRPTSAANGSAALPAGEQPPYDADAT
jgi:hypothetical protein